MRHLMKTLALMLVAGVTIISCKKEVKTAPDEISQETLSKISNLGFSTANVQRIEEGWLVEGDIVLTDASLNETPSTVTLRIAEVEQYSTFNTVDAPRVITISSSGSVSTNVSSAINNAIDRYNALNIGLTFQRVNSGGDITIKVVNGASYIASAGFPSSGGDPYSQVKFNRQYQNWNNNTLTTVFAHEVGHCIGFRHTDWMNRSYSCGTGGSEGQQNTGVGAVFIPGTASGPDQGSWMLACIGNGINRNFNNNDKTALDYLFP